MSKECLQTQEFADITTENNHGAAKRRWGVVACIAGPVIFTALLAAACADGNAKPPKTEIITSAPTPNVLLVNVDDIDRNGDGNFSITDARLKNKEVWKPGLNFDFDWDIDVNDLNLIQDRVGRGSSEEFDVNGDGKVCQDDVEIVEKHRGTIQDDPNVNERLDNLMLASWPIDEFQFGTALNTSETKIREILEKYNLLAKDNQGNLTNVQIEILGGQKIVTVKIPEELLKTTSLGNLIESIRLEDSILHVERIYNFIPNDILDENTDCG